MELSDIEMDTSRSNNEIVYENLKISTENSATESQSKTTEEEHYETFGDSHKRKVESGDDDTVKRLKYVIYVLIVLISVLYITVITLVIVLFVPKEPADGRWAQWSSWTSCDVTCGNGTQLRTRTCTNPMPMNKGSYCIGESLLSSECSKDNCPVDGQWSHWSSWTSCDVTCGLGTHLRSRTCTNPVPTYNGMDCTGENLQRAECSEESCEVDGQWAEWSIWSQCDVTCGNGTYRRTRTCTNAVPMDKGVGCTGENLQISDCSKNICPVDGQWAHWSSWTSCDVTCGQGTRLRSRTCTNPVPANNGLACTGDNLQTAECSKVNCPVHGRWAQWSSWTTCDVTCGNGKLLRLRTCTNPVPMNKGSNCIGESLQSSECSKDNCPVNGQWAHWSSWTSCDVTCGKGSRQRSRTCTNPVPANGGHDCTGAIRETDECSNDACPAFKSAFSVKSPDTSRHINGLYKLTFSKTIYQYGNDFNISTGTYTCNKSGVYHFSVTLVKKSSSSRVDRVNCHLVRNILVLIYIKIDPTDDDTDKGNAAISQSIVINLNVGDTVFLYGCSNPSTTMEDWSSFTGFLLYDNN